MNGHKRFSLPGSRPLTLFLWASCYSHSRFTGTRRFLFLKINGLRQMNISQDFPATLEVSDKNQWFQILSDFHRKWIIGRCYWRFFSCPQPQGKLKKDKCAHRFAIKSLSSASQRAVSVPVVYNNSVFKVDFHCTMKLLVPLWFMNLHRTLTEDDSPLAFFLLWPQWTSLKEGPRYNYGQFSLVPVCTWIIRKWQISPYSNGA